MIALIVVQALSNKQTSSPEQAPAVKRIPASANISAINLKPKSGQSLEDAWEDLRRRQSIGMDILKKEYPKASKSVLQKAQYEQKKFKCKS